METIPEGASNPSASANQNPGLAASDTGKRISGWLKSKAATLEEHVKEMRESTKLIADTIKTQWAAGEERFDVTFTARALGLELDLHDGAVVRLIKPGGQAESLKVQTQDRLVAIAGEPLPTADDAGAFVEAMKQRMSAMPRPVTLTFARLPAPPESETLAAAPSAPSAPSAPAGQGQVASGPEASASTQGTVATSVSREAQLRRCEAELATARSEVAAARQEARSSSSDAVLAVEEAAALRADLADLQLSKVWSAQEAERALAEADSSKTEAAEAKAEIKRLAGELQRWEALHASSEEALAAAGQEASRLRTEVGELESHQGQAAAGLSELSEERQRLSKELARAGQELRSSQEAWRGEEADYQAARAAAAARELELRDSESAAVSQLQELQASEQRAEQRIADLSCEMASLQSETQRQEAGSAASERRLAELKREVERLYAEVKRHEAYGGGAETERLALALEEQEGQAEVAREELSELRAETSRLRRECEERESNTRARTGAVSAPPARPEPAVLGLPEVARGVGEGEGELSGEKAFKGEVPDMEQGLEEQLQELRAQNAELQRQLGARPIVFQFAPLEEEVEAEEEGEVVMGAGTAETPEAPSWRLLAFGALVWCRRRTVRAVVLCRKQRHAQGLERSLRSFTRTLLQRPLLLWLFYAHVLALWVIEFWRQALSTPLETDPSTRLEKMVSGKRSAPSP